MLQFVLAFAKRKLPNINFLSVLLLKSSIWKIWQDQVFFVRLKTDCKWLPISPSKIFKIDHNKRNSISVGLSRYQDKFRAYASINSKLRLPSPWEIELLKISSFKFPPSGSKLCLNALSKLIFWKRKTQRSWLSTHLPSFKNLDPVDLYFWAIRSRKWSP